ncbi:MAG: ATP-binding cassette domain-containing protein, partial [Prevotella sp.]|nr:ATP-binding cassette domain-containing protein [Prevotella sp.]
MISIENLHVEFGARPLYDNVSFVINDRDRIALVGKNGAGKSTLLKIIHGEQSPTSGVISIPNETTIGYLPQVMRIQDDTTVKDEALKALANTISLKKELEAKQEEMAERDDYDSDEYMQLVETFTSLQDRFVM